MAKVYIGFSRPTKFKIGAKAISWWMGTEYSHVFIVFDYQDSKSAVFHAAHGSVHFKSLHNFVSENTILKKYCTEVDQQTHDRLFDRCMELAGEDYSVLELVKIFTADLCYETLHKDIDLGNSSGYICSELVGKLLIEEFNQVFNKPTYLLKPKDIDLKLSESAVWQD